MSESADTPDSPAGSRRGDPQRTPSAELEQGPPAPPAHAGARLVAMLPLPSLPQEAQAMQLLPVPRANTHDQAWYQLQAGIAARHEASSTHLLGLLIEDHRLLVQQVAHLSTHLVAVVGLLERLAPPAAAPLPPGAQAVTPAPRKASRPDGGPR